MQYTVGIGGKGILVQVGGNQQLVDNTTNPFIGASASNMQKVRLKRAFC